MSVQTNIAWYTFPRLLSRGAAFLLLPIYTRVLAPEELGAAMAAVAAGALVGLAVAPGMESAYLRLAYHRRDRAAGATEVGGAVLLHLAFLGFGVSILLALAEPISALLLPGIPTWPFYYLVVADLCLSSLIAPLMAGWRAEQQVHKVALGEFVQLAVSVVAILTALLVLRWGAVAILVGDVVAGGAIFPLAVKRMAWKLREGWDRDAIRTVMPFIVVGLPMSLSGYVLVSADRLIVLRFAGASEVGLYSIAYQIGAAMVVITVILSKEWRPLVFDLTSEGGRQGDVLQRLWSKSVSLFTIGGTVVVLFAEAIVRWGLGERYLAAAALVPWIALASVLRVPRSFMIALGLARGRTRDITVSSCLVASVFVAGNLLLVPQVGAIGATWAGVAAYTVDLLYLFSRAWNHLRFTRAVKASAAGLVGCLVLVIASPWAAMSHAAGGIVVAFLLQQAWAYWRFLGTIRSVRTAL